MTILYFLQAEPTPVLLCCFLFLFFTNLRIGWGYWRIRTYARRPALPQSSTTIITLGRNLRKAIPLTKLQRPLALYSRRGHTTSSPLTKIGESREMGGLGLDGYVVLSVLMIWFRQRQRKSNILLLSSHPASTHDDPSRERERARDVLTMMMFTLVLPPQHICCRLQTHLPPLLHFFSSTCRLRTWAP